MKKLGVLLSLLIALNSVAFAAPDSDGASSGGGTGNVEVAGQFLPADFFADLSGPDFPRKGEKPISLEKDYPELFREFKYISGVITKRNRNTIPWTHKLEDYEIYVVDQLSTPADTIKPKDGRVLIPTAVTYNFSELNKSGRIVAEHRVIELDRKSFFQSKLGHQALDLVHEMLHHEKHEPRASDHQFISPFITGLDTLLKVINRQKKGGYRLTDNEYEKIVTMQNMLENLLGKYGFNKDYEFFVYRNGGGILEVRLSDREWYAKDEKKAAAELLVSQNKKLMENGNIIDALSTAQFEVSQRESGYKFFGDHKILDKQPKGSITMDHFKNNKVLNSMIHFGIWNRACADNTFQDIQRPTLFERAIPIDEVDYVKPRGMYYQDQPEEWKFRQTFYLDCQGSRNVVSNLISGLTLTVRGEGNVIENIGSSISVRVEGNGNRLSNVHLPENIEKNHTVKSSDTETLLNYTHIRIEGNDNLLEDSEPVLDVWFSETSHVHVKKFTSARLEVHRSSDILIDNFSLGEASWAYLWENSSAVHMATPSLYVSDVKSGKLQNVATRSGDVSAWLSRKASLGSRSGELNIMLKGEGGSVFITDFTFDNSPITTQGQYEMTSPIGEMEIKGPLTLSGTEVRTQELCKTQGYKCEDMAIFKREDLNK